uniref:Maturin n=5 Tax=Neognathae TaxID=8825 RepID=A0A803YCK5_MELGA
MPKRCILPGFGRVVCTQVPALPAPCCCAHIGVFCWVTVPLGNGSGMGVPFACRTPRAPNPARPPSGVRRAQAKRLEEHHRLWELTKTGYHVRLPGVTGRTAHRARCPPPTGATRTARLGAPRVLPNAAEETERRMDFYAEPGVSFYVLCPEAACGDNFHVWSESEDCLPFLQLAQDYISSCGKKTLHEILEKVFKSFRPLLGLPDVDDDAFEEYNADMEEEEPEADHQQMGVSQQ